MWSLPIQSINIMTCVYFLRNVGEFYNGKETLPVFDWNPEEKTPIEIFDILMKPAEELTTCTSVPSLISHNACFLLDVRNLPSKNDWKSDDMGSWKNNGVQHLRYHVGEDEDVILETEESREKAGTIVTMKRIYYKNNSSPDVKKIASFLEGMYYQPSMLQDFSYFYENLPRTVSFCFFIEHSHLVFLQYIFSDVEHSVDPSPHGNCKRAHSYGYVRTKESTVKRLQSESSNQTPKPAYHNVYNAKGGIMNADAISDLPRNRAQAKYWRREHTQQSMATNVDSLIVLLEQCKRQQINRDEQPFIREVTGAPELRCVLAFDWQLRDLATFCTDPRGMSVVGADPTFNLGRFNVTVTSYQNLKVINRVNGKHPTMIGPLLISQTKSFDVYNYFFGKIISLNKDTRGVMAFGTDGEEELYRAMAFNFPYAIHLRCFNHFRDNCKEQLKNSNVPEDAQKQFLSDIFGCRVGETWEKGK